MVRTLPNNFSIREDARQLIRSSGSVAANYLEANEALSSKDKLYRMKVARKEVKESGLWLQLLEDSNLGNSDQIRSLNNEAVAIRKILSSIILKLS